MHNCLAMPNDINDNDLLNTAEVCEILGGLHPSTISRWVQLNRIAPTMRAGNGPSGAFLFKRSDVNRLRDELAAETNAADTSAAAS